MRARVLVGALLAVGAMWLGVRSLTVDGTRQVTSPKTTVTAIDRDSVQRKAPVAARRVASNSRKSGQRKRQQTGYTVAAKGPANVNLAALPEATDAYSSASVVKVSGKTLFHDNSPATRVPVVAALVDLDSEMEVVGRTISAEDGSYELAVRHPGQLKLLAQLPGYTVAEGNLGLLNAEIDSLPLYTKHLILYPSSSISGRVTDVHGWPLAGAEVGVTLRLSGDHPSEIKTAYQNYSTVATTATGEFVLKGLPPWDAQVYASKEGYVLAGTTTTAPAKEKERG